MKSKTSLLGLLFLFAISISSNAQNTNTLTTEQAKAKQAYALGATAYIWGYPVVVMQKWLGLLAFYYEIN
jgi:hypothetical protein